MITDFVRQQTIIRTIKQTFSGQLAEALNLVAVEAPILSEQGSGIQDDLSGHEQAVAVRVKAIPEKQFEVVHSLAKWKRQTLAKYGFAVGEGIITDMRALRPDEDSLGAKHSVYVDQWDWEQVISETQRSSEYLKQVVATIYAALKRTEQRLSEQFGVPACLSPSLHFIHSQELVERYPQLTPKQRERAITREHGSVFIMGIGSPLTDGQAHDVRAPDYDDWSSIADDGRTGLNGDLLVWHEAIDDALELSSMGIRVDADALVRQLQLSRQQHRAQLPWHQSLLTGELPLTIGGGIGQSRVVMQLLQLDHIAKTHCSVWPQAIQGAL